jgi:saccharopine dehydrogenase (NAD+, L-lysine-forming)
MKSTILIVGGYGKVGSIITRHLAERYPNQVIVAGRDLKKAQSLSKALDDKVIPYYLDINNFSEVEILEHTKLVIMCIDQNDTAFVKLCIEKGNHYIDITANRQFIQQTEQLNDLAIENQVSIALSVGLAPGITNLLAQNCANQLPKTALIDIFILLGVGEKHGDAAYRWTFDNIHTSYNIQTNRKFKTITSFMHPKENDLLGKRNFYAFNFPDQYTLAKTLKADQVMTRMAFDNKLFTSSVAFLRKIGLTKLFSSKKIQNLLINLFKKVKIGSDVYAVKAVAENLHEELYESSVAGNGEGKITAYVTIETALIGMEKQLPYGVKHLHQIVDNIPDFLEKLKQYDDTIDIRFTHHKQ